MCVVCFDRSRNATPKFAMCIVFTVFSYFKMAAKRVSENIKTTTMVVSWLVTGATGQVGSHVVAELAKSSENVVVALHSGRDKVSPPLLASSLRFACTVHYEAVDFETDSLLWAPRVATLMEEYQTTVVVHCAAIANLNTVLTHPEMAQAVNVTTTTALAQLASQQKCKTFVHCSTDMVFDGTAIKSRAHGSFYTEDEPTCPLSSYGRTKVDAEIAIRSSAVGSATTYIIARLPLMFGVVHTPNGAKGCCGTFIPQLRQLAQAEQRCCYFTDEYRTPLSLRSAARLLIAVSKKSSQIAENLEHPVVLHLAGKERISRYDLMLRIQDALSRALLGNDILLSASPEGVTCYRMLEALGVKATVSSPGIDDQEAQSPRSPLSQLRAVGGSVLNATIEGVSRNSISSAEVRPEDLSMSTERLDLCMKALGLQDEALLHLSLADQLTEALELWMQLLSYDASALL
jgi:dTDP-4-dehydrorhamnose reductase